MGYGASLRAWRLQAGLSQERLAEHVGVARTTITDYERDAKSRPDAMLLERIAVVVGAPNLAALIAGPDQPVLTFGDGPPASSNPPTLSHVDAEEVLMVNVFHGIPDSFTPSDPCWRGTLPMPRSLVPHRHVAAVQLLDDSMFPLFAERATIIVDVTVRRPYLGEHVVVHLHDGRRLFRTWSRGDDRKIVLVPSNRTWGRGDTFQPEHGDSILGVWLLVVGQLNTRRVR